MCVAVEWTEVAGGLGVEACQGLAQRTSLSIRGAVG